MSLETKQVLAIVEDRTLLGQVQEALKPLVKNVVQAGSVREGLNKLQNQHFDVVVYRSNAAGSIGDPQGPFEWSLTRKEKPADYWILLGKDLEAANLVVKHPHVKFLDPMADMPGLVRMMQGLFFTVNKSKATVDVNFVNPVVKAVGEVLQTMAQIQLKRETPFLKSAEHKPLVGDITGLVAMNSDRFMGSFAISFEESLALKVYGNMLGSPASAINDEVKDAVMEMTNIIFGNAKRDLNVMGHTIAPAIPTVITGKGHQINHSVDGACICIPFSSEFGRVSVECVMSFKS